MPLDDRNIADTPQTAWGVRDALLKSVQAFDTLILPAADAADQLNLDVSVVDLSEARDMLQTAAERIDAAMKARAEQRR